MIFDNVPGATPIDPDEAGGLKLKYLTTQAELNAVEQQNIVQAEQWLLQPRLKIDVFSEKFIRQLHLKMFGDVWKWAGAFRRSDKNIGVTWAQVPIALKQLLDDTKFWVSEQTFSWDEIGARFHHRLVAIHCFVNGNGRHARLVTNVFMSVNGQTSFSWGSAHNLTTGESRERYLEALRSADKHQYDALLAFVRS